MRRTLRERFDQKTKPGPIPDTDPSLGPCLDWTGATTGDARGRSRGEIWDGTRQVVAARLAWEWENGEPVPPGMQVDHRCHRPICVRGSHLRAITPKQNSENRAHYRGTKTSRYRGVSWRARDGKWQAIVRHNRTAYWLGYFDDEDEAGQAAAAKRRELFTHSDLDERKA